MDAFIGRYRTRLQETGLILRHATGISFDLTVDETLALLNFLSLYRQALMQDDQNEPEIEPPLERIVIQKDED